jgi:PASTA domain
MALDGDIKVFGQSFPKKAALIGVGVVGVGAVYYIEKRKNAAAVTSAVAAGTADGTTTDPETGFAYGSTEDQAALAQLGTSGLPVQNSSSFQTGNVIGYDEFGDPIYSSQGTGAFSDNGTWTQSALAALINADPQIDSGVISAALGAYINGQPLTPDQISIVNQAIALENKPPVSGPTGNPPGYLTVTVPPAGGTTAPPGTGSTPPVMVTVPLVVGDRAETAISKIQAAGFKAHTSSVINPKNTYSVNSQTPGGNKPAAKGSTVDLGIQTPAARGAK